MLILMSVDYKLVSEVSGWLQMGKVCHHLEHVKLRMHPLPP